LERIVYGLGASAGVANVLEMAAAQAALVGMLSAAGLSKITKTGQLAKTLRALDVGKGTSALARGVVASELAAAVALTIFPAAAWPRALVALLSFGFAAAGARALLLRVAIHCSCFAPGPDGELGWRQVGALPAWLCAVSLAQLSSWHRRAGTGLLGMALLLFVLGVARLLTGMPVWWELRFDRLAFHNLGSENAICP